MRQTLGKGDRPRRVAVQTDVATKLVIVNTCVSCGQSAYEDYAFYLCTDHCCTCRFGIFYVRVGENKIIVYICIYRWCMWGGIGVSYISLKTIFFEKFLVTYIFSLTYRNMFYGAYRFVFFRGNELFVLTSVKQVFLLQPYLCI